MRIDNRFHQSTDTARLNESSETTAIGQDKSEIAGTARTGEDRISLSGLSKLTKLAMESVDDSRAARVEQLRADYQAGKLEVDSEGLASTLADRILG